MRPFLTLTLSLAVTSGCVRANPPGLTATVEKDGSLTIPLSGSDPSALPPSFGLTGTSDFTDFATILARSAPTLSVEVSKADLQQLGLSDSPLLGGGGLTSVAEVNALGIVFDTAAMRKRAEDLEADIARKTAQRVEIESAIEGHRTVLRVTRQEAEAWKQILGVGPWWEKWALAVTAYVGGVFTPWLRRWIGRLRRKPTQSSPPNIVLTDR
jgi:hypothetical protein